MGIISKQTPNFIGSTPLGISIYSAKHEATHYHENCLELIYCIKGSANVISGYETIPVRKGEFLLINCNEVHSACSDDDNMLISFYINFNHPVYRGKKLEHITLMLIPEKLEEYQQQPFKNLSDLILSVLYIYTGNYITDDATFTAISEELTNILINDFTVFFIRNNKDKDIIWSRERFERILLYINTHYNEKLTLKSLSAMEHLNANYLSVYFNNIFLDTFNNYLSVLRAYYSELPLLTTDENISRISDNCGFSDPKFYYKAFKNLYKTTPANHRRQNIEHNRTAVKNREYRINEIRHVIQQYVIYYFSKTSLGQYDIAMPRANPYMNKKNNFSEWRTF